MRVLHVTVCPALALYCNAKQAMSERKSGQVDSGLTGLTGLAGSVIVVGEVMRLLLSIIFLCHPYLEGYQPSNHQKQTHTLHQLVFNFL